MRTALVGALLFKGLGGSFRGLAPSDVCRPGAFFRRRVRDRLSGVFIFWGGGRGCVRAWPHTLMYTHTTPTPP